MIDERTRKQLTATEFINIWASKFVSVKKADGLNYWEERNSKNQHIAVLSLIELSDDIFVKEISGLSHLKLINCKIKSISIERSKIGNFFLLDGSITEDIIIKEASEVGKIKIINRSKTGDINIKLSTVNNIEIENDVVISNTFIQRSSVNYIRCRRSTTGNIDISTSSSVEYISILSNSQVGDIELYNHTKINRVYISDHTIIGDIKIDKSIVEGSISISNGPKVGYVYIYKSTIQGGLKIEDNSSIYGLKVSAKDLRRIILKNSYIQTISWEQDSYCIFSADGCKIETLNFIRTIISKDSVFQLGSCEIGNLQFEQFVNTAWLNISDLKPLKDYERFASSIPAYTEIDFLSKKYIYHPGFTIDQTEIQIINSDLGKTSFIDCRLDQFNKFVFYNTKLLEVFVAGTPLPKRISLPASKTAQYEQNEQERLAFGQFKRIYENRGDTVSATDYLALEMDAYHRYLKQPEVIREKGSTWAERFTIELNRVSSYHNTNWFQAVAMTLGINGIMFAIYCYFLGYEPYVPFYSKIDWHTTLNLFSYSFEFLNPLRKADFLDKVNLEPVRDSWDWVARFWDYFSRIVVAYFVYQTIQAFRRYGKTK